MTSTFDKRALLQSVQIWAGVRVVKSEEMAVMPPVRREVTEFTERVVLELV